jgi:hypothetical protein
MGVIKKNLKKRESFNDPMSSPTTGFIFIIIVCFVIFIYLFILGIAFVIFQYATDAEKVATEYHEKTKMKITGGIKKQPEELYENNYQ